MYRHQGHGFAINRSKKKFGGSFKRIDEGGGEDPQIARRPLSDFSVAHLLGFQCTHVTTEVTLTSVN